MNLRAANARICGALAFVLVATAAPCAPAQKINTIKELFAVLSACWVLPPADQARPGMQITVLLSFKRTGEILGEPRITFATKGASSEQQRAYRWAVAETLARCDPLQFTETFGNAIAGRPFTMRFIDQRQLRQAGNAPWPTTIR